MSGGPATAYDEQGLVFAVAFGEYIRMFDARKYKKGPSDIFSIGGDVLDANVAQFSNDGRLMLLTAMGGHIHVLYSFRGTLVMGMIAFMLGVYVVGKKYDKQAYPTDDKIGFRVAAECQIQCA